MLMGIDCISMMIHCISSEASMRAKQFCVLTTTESRAFKPPPPLVAWAADSSKAVVLLLLVYCLMYSPLFVGRSVVVFVLFCITLCPF